MTKETLQTLTEKRAEITALRAVFERQEVSLEAEIASLEKECDHTRPDGVTAIKGGFTHSTCNICFEDW